MYHILSFNVIIVGTNVECKILFSLLDACLQNVMAGNKNVIFSIKHLYTIINNYRDQFKRKYTNSN